MHPKEFSIRAIRKSSNIANKALSKGEKLTAKIEDKTTKILTGVDFSTGILKEAPFEKIFYNGIKYNICPLNPALPAVGRTGAIVLLIPSLSKSSFYGGTATALIVAGMMAEQTKRKLRIVETLSPGGKEGLGDFFAKNSINIKTEDVELIDVSARKYNVYGYIDLHPEDIHIASAWWDAYLLDQLPLNRKYVYLMQDFEPIFYANSDEYVLAENTYKSTKFIPLCNTKLMYDFLAKRYAYIKAHGKWFEPAVSQAKNGYSVENKVKKRIFLYGRPSVKRNLFYTAINALNIVFNTDEMQVSDWELYMAGQDKLPSIALTSGIKINNLGKMDIDEYYAFAKTIDLTLSLMMAPHPNYPTLELSSIGSAVVTTKYENKTDLSSYSKNIFMANLSTEDIAATILKASKLSYSQRIKNAQQSHIAQDWSKSLDTQIKSIAQNLLD